MAGGYTLDHCTDTKINIPYPGNLPAVAYRKWEIVLSTNGISIVCNKVLLLAKSYDSFTEYPSCSAILKGKHLKAMEFSSGDAATNSFLEIDGGKQHDRITISY